MNVQQLNLNGKKVLIFDAPVNATHGRPLLKDGQHYLVCRKNKVLDQYLVDKSSDDETLYLKYNEKLINVGQLNIAEEGKIADLFNVIKNGNFYDYEYNGVFYPSAVSALLDIVDQEFSFQNPYVLVITE